MTLKEMLEKRQVLATRIEEMRNAAHGRDFTPEEDANWAELNKDYDALSRDIDRLKRSEEIERDLAQQDLGARILREANPDPEGRTEQRANGESRQDDQRLAFDAWFMAGDSSVNIDERRMAACERVGMNPHQQKTLDIAMAPTDLRSQVATIYRTSADGHIENRMAQFMEQRALSAVLGSSGAFTIDPTFIVNLERNMLEFGGMLQVADVIRTARGEPMTWPTVDDTSNTGAQIGESTSEGSSVDPTFAQKTWHAFKFHSKPIRVPVELFEDSSFNIAGMISAMLGERLGRITNTKATTGTGAGTFTGITVASTAGVTSAATTSVTTDEILDLVHSVDPAYRQGGRFMFHDNTLLHLRKKKDGESRYLWQQGMGGSPDTLWTYPYTINQDMAAVTSSSSTGDITIEFGQLNKYKIRQVRNVRLVRLDERYADTDEVGFNAFIRQDGNLLQAGTAPVKHMVQG